MQDLFTWVCGCQPFERCVVLPSPNFGGASCPTTPHCKRLLTEGSFYFLSLDVDDQGCGKGSFMDDQPWSWWSLDGQRGCGVETRGCGCISLQIRMFCSSGPKMVSLKQGIYPLNSSEHFGRFFSCNRAGWTGGLYQYRISVWYLIFLFDFMLPFKHKIAREA